MRVALRDGTVVESATLPARGDAESPLTDAEITAKFHALADGPLGSRAHRIVELISAVTDGDDVAPILDALLSPLEQ